MSHFNDSTAAREADDLRFRGALISSAALHVGLLLVAIVGPMVWPQPPIMPDITPVRLVRLPAAAPQAEPEPAPAPEETPPPPEQEPEPIPAVVTEPEPIPRTLAQLREEERRAEEEEEARRREEEERRREAEEERRRREAEEARRREEEARAQPQTAGRRPPETQSARRTAIDLTGTEENQTAFTVEDFPFAAYLLRIRDMVAERWSPPPRGAYAAARRVEVFFRIDRNGRLVVQPRALSPSGDTLFDQAAMRAIASAAPFPPLPRQYEGQTLGVRFAFVQE